MNQKQHEPTQPDEWDTGYWIRPSFVHGLLITASIPGMHRWTIQVISGMRHDIFLQSYM